VRVVNELSVIQKDVHRGRDRTEISNLFCSMMLESRGSVVPVEGASSGSCPRFSGLLRPELLFESVVLRNSPFYVFLQISGDSLVVSPEKDEA
jgi:hypothetical protein